MNKHGGYTGEKQEEIIDFSVNINPLGVSKKVITRIKENLSNLASYPEIDGLSARKIIAKKLSLHEENIIIGNGASELIYLYAHFFKGKKVLIVQPTFSEYARAFRLNGCSVINHILSKKNNFQIDEASLLSKIKRDQPDLLVLCNPNNPTGLFVEYRRLKEVFEYLKEIKSQVFIDESFIDFTEEKSALSFIDEYPIFIIKSMTKFFAIAGLRLGYGIGNKKILERIKAYKEPWTVNSIALDIVEVLFEDEEYIAKTKGCLLEEKSYLESELDSINGIITYDSSANFYLLKLKDKEVSEVKEKLLTEGIYIRNCDNFLGLDKSYFRIAVRTRAENIKLISSIKDSLRIKDFSES
ncbi:threonine-phosphate decarboxylase CobD [Natronospora cellulosivora (SeqCode)]